MNESFFDKLKKKRLKKNQRYPEEYKTSAAAPNALVQSNVFGVVKKGTAKMLEKKPLTIQGSRQMYYTGRQLCQVDLDIWLSLKKLWIKNDCQVLVLSTNEVLKALQKTGGNSDKKWLKEKVIQLATASIIYDPLDKNGFVGPLITNLAWDGDGESFKHFTVGFDENLVNLFNQNKYTYLDLEARRYLKSDLAKWLYNYYRSNDKCFSVYDHYLQSLCGSTANKFEFRRQLKLAGEELVNSGFLEFFEIDREGKVKSHKKVQLVLTEPN